MKRIIVGLVLACAFTLAGMSQDLRILSLNNSLIDYNNQPAMFNAMAKAEGKDAVWEARTQLGKTLIYHYNDMLSHQMATSGDYDVLILQEQSALPRNHSEVLMQSVILWKRALQNMTPSNVPQIILPMNWGYSDWDDFKQQTKQLKRSYLDVEREVPGVMICPVGVAYELIYDKDGPEACATLYTDNRHPSLKASYLAACMEYAVIFGEDPTTISFVPDGLSAEDAQAMRHTAKEALAAWTSYRSLSR